MPVCPHCGEPVSEDAGFCASCGTAMPAALQADAGAPPPPPGPAAGSPPPPPPGSVPPPIDVSMPSSVHMTTPPPASGPPPAYVPRELPPPPVMQKTGKIWKIVIISVLAGLLLIGGGLAATVYFVYRAVKPPVDATNQFIEAINEGDAQGAWELLHPSSWYKENYDRSEFEREVVDSLAGSLETWNANRSSISGSEAEVEVDLTYSGGGKDHATFYLRKSGDAWMIVEWLEDTSPTDD